MNLGFPPFSAGFFIPLITSGEPSGAIVIRETVSKAGFGVKPLNILVTADSGRSDRSAISA